MKKNEIIILYHKNLFILSDEIAGVVGERVLKPSSSYGDQEIVVNVIVTAECDEDQCLLHQLLCLVPSNKITQPLLICLEQLQLPWDS